MSTFKMTSTAEVRVPTMATKYFSVTFTLSGISSTQEATTTVEIVLLGPLHAVYDPKHVMIVSTEVVLTKL